MKLLKLEDLCPILTVYTSPIFCILFSAYYWHLIELPQTCALWLWCAWKTRMCPCKIHTGMRKSKENDVFYGLGSMKYPKKKNIQRNKGLKVTSFYTLIQSCRVICSWFVSSFSRLPDVVFSSCIYHEILFLW